MRDERWFDLLVLFALVGLVLLWVGRAFLPGKVLLPLDVVTQLWPPWQQPDTAVIVHNPLITDVVDYIYPVKAFVAEQVKEGTVPLWNPYVLGGYPLTYNTQAGLWYPLSLLYYVLEPAIAVDLTIFWQLFLGGVFMFAYLRQLRLRRAAAFLGVVLFLYNGMMVVWLEWQVIHAAVIWLPLCLFFVERVAQKLESRNETPTYGVRMTANALLAGCAFALPWLGGHWNWALYSSLTAVVYLLWRLRPFFLKQTPIRKRKLISLGLLTLAVGAGLSAIQVLPAFIYLSQGHRQPFTLAQSLALGLKDRAIVALIPDFFGNPVAGSWWGPTNYNETAFYLGILPLFLVALVPFLWGDRITRFYAVWSGVGLSWALGTVAYAMLWVLPVFNGLWPSRAVTVVVFGTAVLAALVLDKLLDGNVNGQHLKWVAVGVTAVLLGILSGYLWYYRPERNGLQNGILWFGLMLVAALLLLLARPRLKPDLFALLAVALVMIDLFWIGRAYNTIGDVADLYPETETARFLRSDPTPYRITTLPQGVAYPPNSSLQDQIPALSGYEPAILQTWVDYLKAAEGQDAIYFERELMPLHGLDSPLLAAVNLKYVVTINDWYQEISTAGTAQEVVEMWVAVGETAVPQNISVSPGLHRLDLPLQISPGSTGMVTLRIFTPDGGQEVAHAGWDVTELLTEGWASFYFTPFPSEWGRDFLLTAVFSGEGEVSVGSSNHGLAFRSYYLPRPQLVHEAGKTRVYVNNGYFPRAYIVPQALVAPDAAQALARVVANQDRLDEVVVLEMETQVDAYTPGGTGTAVITEYDLNQVVIHTQTDRPAYLVLADTYYPGWQAAIDGESTAVYRANSVVRAVAVPAGVHEVVFTFRPIDFYVGAAITAVTLLFVITVCVAAIVARAAMPNRERQ